jgi:hypothetical protein
VRRNFNYSVRLVMLSASLLLVGLHYFACLLWLVLRVQVGQLHIPYVSVVFCVQVVTGPTCDCTLSRLQKASLLRAGLKLQKWYKVLPFYCRSSTCRLGLRVQVLPRSIDHNQYCSARHISSTALPACCVSTPARVSLMAPGRCSTIWWSLRWAILSMCTMPGPGASFQ